jgi:hypothetical protein
MVLVGPVWLREVDDFAHGCWAGEDFERNDFHWGKVVNDLEPKDRGISMVFQSYALYPHMNLFNNMAFGLKLAKKPKEFISEIVGKTFRRLDSITCWSASRERCREVSASAWRWAGRLCAIRRYFVRRAIVESGCEDAGSDAHGDFAASCGVGLHDDLCDARSGGGDDDGRPHLCDARRQHHAGSRSADLVSSA